MKFLFPEFLFALSAIAIPIIIHLFNFRKYKKVYFSNVQFLQEVKKQTTNHNRLKHLLILLTRILAVCFLVFGFSQPYIPENENEKDKNEYLLKSIYLDNSFSMEAISAQGQMHEYGKQIAFEILDNSNQTDKIQLLSNEFAGSQQRIFNPQKAETILHKQKIAPISQNLKSIINRQEEALSSNNNAGKEVYVISDFPTTWNVEDLPIDSSINYYLIPIQNEDQKNLFIDSVWFYSPIRKVDENEIIKIKVVNYSNEDYQNIPIRLTINEEEKAFSNFSIKANSTEIVELSYLNTNLGWISGSVKIEDYPITFDDDYFFSYHINKKLKVVSIYEGDSSNALARLFRKEPRISFNQWTLNAIKYEALTDYNLIIINSLKDIPSGLIDEIEKASKNNVGVFIIPPSKGEIDTYNNLLSKLSLPTLKALKSQELKVGSINTDDVYFEGVFESIPKNINLPITKKHYTISGLATILLSLENKDPFLVKSSSNAFLLTTGISDEWNNLEKHSIILPLFYRACYISQKNRKLAYRIGKDKTINIPYVIKDEVVTIKSATKEFIPEISKTNQQTILSIHDQVEESGHYSLLIDGQNEILSFNYNRDESETNYWGLDELSKKLEEKGLTNIEIITKENLESDAASLITKTDNTFWRQCLLFVLLFVLIEGLLLRFWK